VRLDSGHDAHESVDVHARDLADGFVAFEFNEAQIPDPLLFPARDGLVVHTLARLTDRALKVFSELLIFHFFLGARLWAWRFPFRLALLILFVYRDDLDPPTTFDGLFPLPETLAAGADNLLHPALHSATEVKVFQTAPNIYARLLSQIIGIVPR